MDDDFRRAALDYHRLPQPGKLAIEPTKRMATQRDLSLAYSPVSRRPARPSSLIRTPPMTTRPVATWSR